VKNLHSIIAVNFFSLKSTWCKI